MRLSDAIALGRTLLRPRAYMTISRDGAEGCALGMAMAANGCRSHDECTGRAAGMGWHWVKKDVPVAPCDCVPEADFILRHSLCFQAYIAHLFNEHVCGAKDWTLDQLIDWVRSVEPAEAVETHADEKTIAESAPSLVAQG